jgi:hypothetical protein
MAKDAAAQIDIPSHVPQIDETGFVWTLLDDAHDPAVVTAGATVIAAGEVEPVVARVVDLVPGGDRTIVHLEVLPGDPRENADCALGGAPTVELSATRDGILTGISSEGDLSTGRR